jgi:predicted PP-loop superfamily ATPase
MSDRELKSEIESLVKTSGYQPSKSMLCSVIRVVSMRHRDISRKQILRVAKEIL